jgi:quinolinate synthase
MRKRNPEKEFIPVPPDDSSCACNECAYMRLTTLKKIYNALKYEQPEIKVRESIRKKAEKSIIRMLELS